MCRLGYLQYLTSGVVCLHVSADVKNVALCSGRRPPSRFITPMSLVSLSLPGADAT